MHTHAYASETQAKIARLGGIALLLTAMEEHKVAPYPKPKPWSIYPNVCVVMYTKFHTSIRIHAYSCVCGIIMHVSMYEYVAV